jgi:hypothetical protein
LFRTRNGKTRFICNINMALSISYRIWMGRAGLAGVLKQGI